MIKDVGEVKSRVAGQRRQEKQKGGSRTRLEMCALTSCSLYLTCSCTCVEQPCYCRLDVTGGLTAASLRHTVYVTSDLLACTESDVSVSEVIIAVVGSLCTVQSLGTPPPLPFPPPPDQPPTPALRLPGSLVRPTLAPNGEVIVTVVEAPDDERQEAAMTGHGCL